MGKDMIIEILKSQLEAANATILAMSEEMKSMRRSFEATISDLQKTIANLESLLQERDSSLDKAANELRGMKAVAFPKSEKQKVPAGKCAAMPNGAPPEAYRNLLPDRWKKE